MRVNNAAKLATQLTDVSYKASVTHEGDTVNVRVGDASLSDVRRAMCRQMGWPSGEGKMLRLAETLVFLRLAGITKLKIVGDTETLEVELEKGGRCRNAA
ncbi:MAG TPA: hypothetical protein VJ810_19260 [Blastocatellia bacterium]|nr:hypothetical protein [Blastocatellia bacterium]